jgi:hypothetical protein
MNHLIKLFNKVRNVSTTKMSKIIEVNSDTDNPEKAWVKLKNKIPKIELKLIELDSIYDTNKYIRIVCISDTHNRTKQ